MGILAMDFDRLIRDPGLPDSNPTKSYWQSPGNQKVLNIQSSTLPDSRDVVVLGSGITGCSVASTLLRDAPSLSISVLDAREICSGATGRNGGRINCTAVQDYDKYRKSFGDEVAKHIVRFELAHLDAILAFAEEQGPEILKKSEVRRVPAVAAVFEDSKLAELQNMLNNFEHAFPDLKGNWEIIGRREVVEKHGITNARGALVGRAGAAWPYRLITEVFARLKSENEHRLTLEANTPALSIERTQDTSYPYSVKTPRGIIKAKHIVHCTEGHVAHLLPRLRGLLVPRRGEMTVQNPGSGFPQLSDNSWSFIIGSGLDYATQNPHTGELFIGGGDTNRKTECFGIGSDAEEDVLSLAHLGGILLAAFGIKEWGSELPGKRRIVASWTGIMCNSIDSVPFVGMIPQSLLDRPAGDSEASEWICAGYGGYGMVNAFLCAKAVAKMMQGEDVSSWLPQPFNLTEQRIARLQRALGRLVHSQEAHARALL